MATKIHAWHDVEPDQFEPGLVDEDQAYRHVLDFIMADWDVKLNIGLSDSWAVDLHVPIRLSRGEAEFQDMNGQSLPEFTSIHHRDETLIGLADASVVGRHRIEVSSETMVWRLDLSAGVSLPTGGTEPNPFELGRNGQEHQHLFFGTGTVNPILGIESAIARSTYSIFGWSSWKTALYENKHGYKGPGQWGGGLGVDSMLGSQRWGFQIGSEFFHEVPATWSGEVAKNSGRTDLIGVIRTRFMPSTSWTHILTVKVPRTLRVEGGQMTMPVLIGFDINRQFDL